MSTDAGSAATPSDPFATPTVQDFGALPGTAGTVPEPAAYPPGSHPSGAPAQLVPPPPTAYTQLPPAGYAPGYAPPPYGAPIAPYGYYNPMATSKNWMNILSLVLSITAIFTYIGVIPGIIFGHLGVAAAKRGEADNGGLGKAGLIVGYVFAGLGALGILAYVVFFVVLVAAGSSSGY